MTARTTRQRGAAVVEFALVIMILIILLFGLIEVGRVLYVWNSAVQATRAGARTAAIAAIGDRERVLDEMRVSMPDLADTHVDILYSINGVDFLPAGGCVPGTCVFVQVRINQTFEPGILTPFSPFLPELLMPGFATTMPVEALGTT